MMKKNKIKPRHLINFDTIVRCNICNKLFDKKKSYYCITENLEKMDNTNHVDVWDSEELFVTCSHKCRSQLKTLSGQLKLRKKLMKLISKV